MSREKYKTTKTIFIKSLKVKKKMSLFIKEGGGLNEKRVVLCVKRDIEE